MELRIRLKELRVKKGMTQEALAQSVGVTRQTIISVEKGKFIPSVRLALMLASALGAPLEDVFWLDPAEGGRQ
jgi:putative transcriptional regulator